MQKKNVHPLTKTIEEGKFYLIHDGSRAGHPGFIVLKDDEKNRYLAIRTESDKYGDIPKKTVGKKHITLLKHPTESKVVNSYVHNRPMICKRKDIGNRELVGMSFHSDDMKLIENISIKKPELAPSFKNKK